MPEKRQLAAIMFTDIVGYTALMGRDSKKALEMVRKNREIQKPLVEKCNGIWLKEMGDGALARFGTALDAVNCAVEIQKKSKSEFEGDIRIGIHLGDITIENEDVFGDGVNVASRLESLADPGGIYISEAVEKSIHGQSTYPVKYLGEKSLKNVSYKVRTYAIQGNGLPVPGKSGINKKITKGQIPAVYLIVAVMMVILLSLFIVWMTYDSDESFDNVKVLRSSIIPPENVSIELIGNATVGVGRRVIDISEKGDKVAFIGMFEKDTYVFIRNLEDYQARPILDTKGAYYCLLSPDGDEVAYLVDNTIRKIRLDKGSPQVLAEVPNPLDIAWGKKGILYYSGDEGDNIYKFSGNQQLLRDLDGLSFSGTSVSMVREEDLLLISGDDIILYDLLTGERHILGINGFGAQYLKDGYIIFTIGSTLHGIRYNLSDKKILSESFEIMPGIRSETYGNSQFDISDDGTLVYIAGESTRIGSLTWVNRSDEIEILPFAPEDFGQFKLSPDGQNIAVPVFGPNSALWIYNLATMKRFKVNLDENLRFPVWIDNYSLYVYNIGSGLKKISINNQFQPSKVLGDYHPSSLDASGNKMILYQNAELYIWDIANDSIRNLTNNPEYNDFHGSISPDGTLVAYTSDRSNAFHVYLQEAFPGGKLIQVSGKEGSEEPRWTSDGRAIIYRSGQQWMEVALIDKENMVVGSPKMIMEGDYVNIGGFSFDITPDGQRFLVSKGTEVRRTNELKIVRGWASELNRFNN